MSQAWSPSTSEAARLTEDYDDLYENAPCGYLSTHPDGRIFKTNATFARWIGHAGDALVGRRFQDLLNIAGKIYYETHFAPLLRMQGFFNEVALDLVCAEGGKLPVLVNAVERRDDLGRLLFTRITVFNATDRRRYERELLVARQTAIAASEQLRQLNATLEQRIAAEVEQRIKAEDALRQAQKMEALGQLTGGVAHDFNNLLTVIMGGLDTIGRQLARLGHSAETARIAQAREMAWQGVRRAATLTGRLLAFSRRQPLDARPIEPSRVVLELATLLSRTIGEAIELKVSTAPEPWRVRADPSELENALINLAVNARDAMPEGGALTIATANAVLGEAEVAGMADPVPAGAYVVVAVTDTGTGMDHETMARVFEPFFTTKPAGQGTGLGLSQVYGFAQQSGGHVRIDSELGSGTTVRIFLPRLVAAEETHDHADTRPGTAAVGGRETILVVEDDADVRAYATAVLAELGYAVLEAANGRAALALMQAHPAIAVLFTDMVLPDGMNGRRLAELARNGNPKLKVVITTGYAGNEFMEQGLPPPGVDVLAKPFTRDGLAAKIRAALEPG